LAFSAARSRQRTTGRFGATLAGMRPIIAALLAVPALAWRPEPARACSQNPPGINSRDVMPRAALTEVPTNARVVVVYGASVAAPPPPSIGLRALGGAEVEVDLAVTNLGYGWRTGWVVVATPKQPLAADTTYEVLDAVKVPCSDADCVLPQPVVIEAFTTGAGSDTTPPLGLAAGAVMSRMASCEADACCGPHEVVAFTVSFAAASDDGGENTMYDLIEVARAEPLARAHRAPMFTLANVCSGTTFNLYEATDDGGTYLLRAYDLAGNIAESPPLTVEVACPDPWPSDAGPPAPDAASPPMDDGDAGGCGCRTMQRRSGSGALVALLIVLGLGVRHRKRQWLCETSQTSQHRP
jgi:MYXO-CTERM domain-containing protein